MPFRLLPFGRRSELLAIRHLRSLGYRVVKSGYRTTSGEIDVIAWDGPILVFIEVKSRQNTEPPERLRRFHETPPHHPRRPPLHFRYRLHDSPYRFDMVAVTALPGSKPQFRLLKTPSALTIFPEIRLFMTDERPFKGGMPYGHEDSRRGLWRVHPDAGDDGGLQHVFARGVIPYARGISVCLPRSFVDR